MSRLDVSTENGLDSDVELAIYDVAGRRIDLLVRGEQEPGIYELRWRPGSDSALPSGIYFAKLSSGGSVTTTKLILAR
jgi:hypothetical protein